MKSNFLRYSFTFLEIHSFCARQMQRQEEMRGTIADKHVSRIFFCLTEVEFIYGFRNNPTFFTRNEGKIQFYLFICCDWQNAKTVFFSLISTDTCQHYANLVKWGFFSISAFARWRKVESAWNCVCNVTRSKEVMLWMWNNNDLIVTTRHCDHSKYCAKWTLNVFASLGWKVSLDNTH